MNGLEDSQAVYRAVVIGVGLYFALVIGGMLLNSTTAVIASNVVFGIISIGIGVLFAVSRDGSSLVLLGAATAFISGGLAKLVGLATDSTTLDSLGSLFVFVGIGCYAYLVWNSS